MGKFLDRHLLVYQRDGLFVSEISARNYLANHRNGRKNTWETHIPEAPGGVSEIWVVCK